MITTVWAALRVTPVTVIVCPATETTPKLDVVKPGPQHRRRGVQPAGTSTVKLPLEIPPAATV